MTRGVWMAAVALGFAGCDDEVVGFADSVEASTSAASIGSTSSGSTSAEVSTSSSSSDDTSGESSSTGGMPQAVPDYVAYGFDAGVAVSFDDGESWTDVPELVDMPVREGVAGGDGRIVLVGGDRAAVTQDGLAWTVNAHDVPGYARDVAFGQGGFASVGLGHLAWSVDGEVWTDARGDATEFDLVGVAHAEGRFVAVGVDQIATSVDGQDWTLTPIGGGKLTTVAYGNGRFVATGEFGRIFATQDGVSVLLDEATGLEALGTIRFCNGSFVLGGAERYWLSPEGGAWTEQIAIGEGAFACSGTSWVVAKVDGLFWGPQLGTFDAVHTAKNVFYEVNFTGPA